VFVHKDIWDKFVPALVARTAAMKIGNPLSEETTVGATISREHAEKVLSYIDRAKQAVHANLLCMPQLMGALENVKTLQSYRHIVSYHVVELAVAPVVCSTGVPRYTILTYAV